MKTSFFGMFKSRPRVRMAPSPTGNLHIGTARATLFNFLYARHTGGTFVMRIEDTDKERSKPEFEENIIEGLTWLGLSWDEFYRQSERTDVYRAALKKLISKDKAYVSKEPSKQNPEETVEVVRLRNPGKVVTFNDLVRGEITFDTTELGDFVIARSIDDPLYHLAVVVDDGEMGITHIIRSEDHISNTPRQILIMEALGYSRPVYVHQPLVLAPDKSKLSKRHGATALSDYRDMGFIPEALVNFLAFLGWNPGTEQELFTMDQLIESFDLDKLQKSGAVFDMDKLLWFNREHLKRLSASEFEERMNAFAPEGAGDPAMRKMLPLLHERVGTLREAAELASSSEFAFIRKVAEYDARKLIPTVKNKEFTLDDVRTHLMKIMKLLEPIPANVFSAQNQVEEVFLLFR